jgi:hypothetical protein
MLGRGERNASGKACGGVERSLAAEVTLSGAVNYHLSRGACNQEGDNGILIR